MVQGGPGATQPGGVIDDGVSHLLVSSGPYEDVIPGLNCSTVTTIGVQLTFGFQDERPLGPTRLSGAADAERDHG